MIILGIETSCDETAAALVKFDRGRFSIISNIVSSQVKIHSKYGGIVPEVAARNHVVNIIPVVDEAMRGFKPSDIDAIAVTNGPGLITSLLVGVETAKALAYVWEKPLIAVNHLEGHLYSAISNFQFPISKQILNSKFQISKNFDFPVLALIVSGGHTQLVLMKGRGKYEIVGETRDDACGEAFDKVAKLLGLGYPGGPVISAKTEKFQNPNNKLQTNSKFKISNSKLSLPRPMIETKDFDFSFSGLKTAVLYETRGKKLSKKYIAEVCAEFQQAVIDVLIAKTIKAGKKYEVKTIILAGGVSANKELREQMADAVKKELPSSVLCLPSSGLYTDNAAMIAIAGVYHYLKKDFVEIDKIKVDPNLNF